MQFGYLKVDQLDVVANENINKVNVSLDNSDPEKTSISFFSQLITDKEMLRAKVKEINSSRLCTVIFLQIMFLLRASGETVKNEKLFRCGAEILKTNIDVCKMAKIQSTTFAKVLMENFAHSSDFELKCPLKPRNYSMTDFS